MSEEKKKEAITEKKVNRRSMLKWTGALAAVAVVGGGVGYGVSEALRPPPEGVTPPPPTPPLSFKPPLSSEVKSRVDAIVKGLVDRHAGDTVTTAGVPTVHMATEVCKVYVKDGKIKSVIAGDTINPNIAREDAYISKDELMKGHIQSRGKANTYAIHKYMQDPTLRVCYPMKRVSPRGEPNGQFVRITWEEAFDTIGSKMKQLKEKYGDYWMGGFGWSEGGFLNRNFTRGAAAWGNVSYGTQHWATGMMLGAPMPSGLIGDQQIMEQFKTKLIVLWGTDLMCDEIAGRQPNVSYLVRLVHESGAPLIVIDPVEQSTGNVADQWIPIRGTTDLAMLLAVANVLYKEDLYDKAYVAKWVEPTGFDKWKDYLLGKTAGPDGAIDRTPEWAEKICGVPAETIRGLARLMARSKPCWFRFGSAPGRQHKGEVAGRAATAIAAMTGNIGVRGGGDPNASSGMSKNFGLLYPAYDRKQGPLPFSPCLFRAFKSMDAILLREDYDKGTLSKDDYYRILGNDVDNPAPNVKMWVYTSNKIGALNHPIKQLKSIQKLEMAVYMGCYYWNPTARACDIVLPQTVCLEASSGEKAGSSSAPFMGQCHGMIYNVRVVPPIGEAMDSEWTATQLCKRLGISDWYMPHYTTDAEYDKMNQDALKRAYEKFKTDNDAKPVVFGDLPTWEELPKKPIIRSDARMSFVWSKQIETGAPFGTKSGKIEFCCTHFKDGLQKGAECTSRDICVLTDVPPDKQWTPVEDLWKGSTYGPFPPMPMYEVKPRGPFDPMASKYPLVLIDSAHQKSLNHTTEAGCAEIKDFRAHRLWMNPADAKMRGIKDNDVVRIWNDLAQMLVNVYVNSRTAPGTVMLRHGAWNRINNNLELAMDNAIGGDGLGGQGSILMTDGITEKDVNGLLRDNNYWGQDPHNNVVEVEKF